MTGLIRRMSQAETDASRMLDESGKSIIDPENNKTPQQGAATSVWCTTSPQLDGMGGVSCADCDVAPALPSDGSLEMHRAPPRAIDLVTAGRLWQLIEQLTGTALD